MPRAKTLPLTPPTLRILIAYPYLQKGNAMASALQAMARQFPSWEFLIDSGAFTAHAAGKSIHLDDYCRFLESYPVRPWRYFTLDVIGNPEATRANYFEMLRRGFKPIPIFTNGEDPRMIDEYYATSDLIAIGGLVGTLAVGRFVNAIMRHVAGRPVHLLGFTVMNWLKVYKPYSADSSSWESATRYGRIPLYLGNGRMTFLCRKDLLKPPSATIQSVFHRLGVDWTELRKPAAWHGAGSVTHRTAARSWILLSLDAAKHLGTRLFIALDNGSALKVINDAYDAINKRVTLGSAA